MKWKCSIWSTFAYNNWIHYMQLKYVKCNKWNGLRVKWKIFWRRKHFRRNVDANASKMRANQFIFCRMPKILSTKLSQMSLDLILYLNRIRCLICACAENRIVVCMYVCPCPCAWFWRISLYIMMHHMQINYLQ